MGAFETLSRISSEKIANSLGYDEDQREVIAYGAFALLHTVFSTVLILLVGFLVGAFLPTIILCVASPVLRKYTGGAHCSSANRCAVAGAITYPVMALVVKMLVGYGSFALYALSLLLTILISLILVLKYCPVDSPNKPIKREETKKRLRRGALSFVGICIILVLILNFTLPDSYSFITRQISLSISIGLIWQSMTLTLAGHGFIYRLDHALKYIIKS